MRFRAATAQDIQSVLGHPAPRSMRAIAFERDGKVLGCAGLYVTEGHQVIFFDGDHAEVRKAPVTAIKAAKHLLGIAKRNGIPVFAHAAEQFEASERMLEHLGFRRKEGRVFRWHGSQ